MAESGMNPLEQDVMDHLLAAWETYLALIEQCPEQNHSDDLGEFRAAIHACQSQLVTRIVRRDYPGYWRHSSL